MVIICIWQMSKLRPREDQHLAERHPADSKLSLGWLILEAEEQFSCALTRPAVGVALESRWPGGSVGLRGEPMILWVYLTLFY